MANMPQSRTPPIDKEGTNGRLERTKAINAGTKESHAGPSVGNLRLGNAAAKIKEQMK